MWLLCTLLQNCVFNWLYRTWDSFFQRVESFLEGGRGEGEILFFHEYMFGLGQNYEIRKSVSLIVTSYHLELSQIQWARRHQPSKFSPMSPITVFHSSLKTTPSNFSSSWIIKSSSQQYLLWFLQWAWNYV